MKDTKLIPPNHEYLELSYVHETATGKGLNSHIIMQINKNNPNVMEVTEGRTGIRVGRNRPYTYRLPANKWNTFYTSKIQKGYIVTKSEKMEKKQITSSGISVDGKSYRLTKEPDVDEVISILLNSVNKVISENYQTSVEDISDEMLELGEKCLKSISDNKQMSVAEFNNKLKLLYAAIPRRIDILYKCLAKTTADFNGIADREWGLYDVIKSQVRGSQVICKMKTIPESFGLTWRTVDANEEKYIKSLMGSSAKLYKRAFKITNCKTENAFNDFCKKENLSNSNDIQHLFHGSRTQNFFSIITNGLAINPSGVITNGKMFGYGTYFANKAKKSLGYASIKGSCWANGSDNTGFLGIYKVATGKPYDVFNAQSDLTYDLLQKRCPGAHSVWAHAGKSLLNDEIIVYKNEQSTIEYFVQVELTERD